MNRKTIFMPAELLAKWLAALRSGEYKQAKHKLRNYIDTECGERTSEIGYCCLGVLQMVVDGEVETQSINGVDERNIVDGLLPMSLPSPEWLARNQIKFLGRYCPEEDEDGNVMEDETVGAPYLPPLRMSADAANDGVGGHGGEQYSFADIADAIEAAAKEPA